jgi:hypothetical protein
MELILEEHRRKGDLGGLSAQELKKKHVECKSFKFIDQHSGTCCM